MVKSHADSVWIGNLAYKLVITSFYIGDYMNSEELDVLVNEILENERKDNNEDNWLT